MPSKIKMAISCMKAFFKFLFYPNSMVDRNVMIDRMTICGTCEYLKEARCTICGCYVPLKTCCTHEICPKGFWK